MDPFWKITFLIWLALDKQCQIDRARKMWVGVDEKKKMFGC